MLTLSQIQAAAQFPYLAIFENGATKIDRYGEYEYMVGIASADTQVFTTWEALAKTENIWRMGILPYELKKCFEPLLISQKEAEISFPEVAFFEPECLIVKYLEKDEVQVFGKKEIWQEILQAVEKKEEANKINPFVSNYTEQEYLETIKKLQNHILQGDCYEINLTQRFLAETFSFSPSTTYYKLQNIAKVPFSAFIKWQNQYLICASPERFLALKKNTLISQPIKGTAPRGKNAQEDMANKAYLQNSIKEQAENVMIVDLTRNDMYRSCEKNSVTVPYLFEIQSFSNVHQLVSTVIGKKKAGISWAEIITNTFPPGSMTGAPKVRTCQLIEEYETVARGIYAGCAGFISPENDFDFNIIIRSLVFDAQKKLLSYHVGGAITYDSVPEQEYAETLLKAEAIRKVLTLSGL